jgi:hypothetical protein
MKKIKNTYMKKLILLGMAVLAMTACSKDNNPGLQDKVALDVSGIKATIANGANASSNVLSKATSNPWTANSAIGIFMMNTGTVTDAGGFNRQYITADGSGSFAPAAADQTIYFPVDETKKVDFTAYYPYASTLTSGTTVTLNLSDQSNQSALDFLVANKVTGKDKTDPTVALVFTHKLARIQLTMKAGTGVTAADLAGMTVKIDQMYKKAYYGVPGMVLSAAHEDLGEITLKSVTDGSIYVATIVPTTSSTAPANGCPMTITLANNLGVFSYTLFTGTTIDAGKQYNYTVTINRTELTVTGTITDWTVVDGGTVDANE